QLVVTQILNELLERAELELSLALGCLRCDGQSGGRGHRRGPCQKGPASQAITRHIVTPRDRFKAAWGEPRPPIVGCKGWGCKIKGDDFANLLTPTAQKQGPRSNVLLPEAQ